MKFVRWDWASTTHDITVLDQTGQILERWACAHTETDLVQTLGHLSRHGHASTLPVIIERTSGLVIDRLLAAGHPVVPVHPTAFHAARPRWGPPARNPTRGTATSLPITYGLTATACAAWNPSSPGYASCKAWSDCAMTTSPPKPQPATNWVHCWMRTGPDHKPCSIG